MSGAQPASPSGLSFFGVPVEAIAGMTAADFAPGSYYSQAIYSGRRPAGTPLLAAPAAPARLAPAAHVTDYVASVLSARAGGSTPSQSRGASAADQQRLALELQLALSEQAAERAGGPVAAPAPAPDPGVPASLGAPFGASVTPRPPWFAAALAASLARARLPGGPPAMPSYAAGEDPVQYASAASAFWQGVSPFGWGEAQEGAARAAALGLAVAAGAPPEQAAAFPVGAAPPPAGPPAPPAWLLLAASGLAALAGRPGASPPGTVAPSPERLSALAQDLYDASLAPGPAPGGRELLVFTAASAAACLAALDAMGDTERREV